MEAVSQEDESGIDVPEGLERETLAITAVFPEVGGKRLQLFSTVDFISNW